MEMQDCGPDDADAGRRRREPPVSLLRLSLHGPLPPAREMCVKRTILMTTLCALGAGWLLAGSIELGAQQPKPAAPTNDLDAFMAKVLERRNENWRTLHDYILSERETFQILGPGDLPLIGQRREFQWFIREGYLVRSPVKANGASLSAGDRTKYENEWLAKEQAREKKARDRTAAQAKKDSKDPQAAAGQAVDSAVKEGVNELAKELAAGDPEAEKEVVAMVGGEPRFISEAYFMKFPFEPGNYYLAGRETIDGRSVVKVEYYPSNLFKDDEKKDGGKKDGGTSVTITAMGDVKVEPTDKKPAAKPAKTQDPKKKDKGDEMEQEIERAMNKVTLVTMWIDPAEHQIVRFTFDNVDFNFLPGRAIVRVDEAKASMTMGRYFDNVWLPKELVFRGGATFASGSYAFRYMREFYDYRKGEVSARIRAYVPKEP